MKQTKKVKRNLNDIIVGLNRPAFVFIIIFYVVFLALIIYVATPKRDYLIVPDYEHILYPEEIKPQVTIVGLRTFDTEGKMTLRYSVAAKLSGKINESSLDPGFRIDRFQMSAYLTTNKMYYFTEQNNNITPISHTYTLDNAIEERVPSKFFLNVIYKDKENQTQVVSFSETMLLELTNREAYTNKRTITKVVGEGDAQTTETLLRLSFIATRTDVGYSTSVRISPTNMRQNYHVDMQSWIVTEDGEALPFIGVYGYSDERSTYNQSNRVVNHLLNPEFIYAKLTYYVEGEETKTILYKERFDNLPTSHTVQPADPTDEEPTNGQTPTQDRLLQSLIYIGGAMIAGVLIAGTIYYINEKRKKPNKQ